MYKLTENELNNVKGGGLETLSGTIISALSGIIKMVKEAGYDIGSGIRRIIENEICSLK